MCRHKLKACRRKGEEWKTRKGTGGRNKADADEDEDDVAGRGSSTRMQFWDAWYLLLSKAIYVDSNIVTMHYCINWHKYDGIKKLAMVQSTNQ